MNYSGIIPCSIAEGPGVSVVLFVSGCTCKCPGCHNTECQNFDYGKKFDNDAYNKLHCMLDHDYVDHFVISGGHPLEEKNIGEVINILCYVHTNFPKLKIWLYTGLTFEKALEVPEYKCALSMCDVCVDGPYIEDERDITLAFRGSKNQRIIDAQKSINDGKITIINFD